MIHYHQATLNMKRSNPTSKAGDSTPKRRRSLSVLEKREEELTPEALRAFIEEWVNEDVPTCEELLTDEAIVEAILNPMATPEPL